MQRRLGVLTMAVVLVLTGLAAGPPASAATRPLPSYLSLPAGSVAIAPAFVEPVPAAARADSLRYRSLSAECKRVPISERNSCVDEASLGYARPEPIGSTSLG